MTISRAHVSTHRGDVIYLEAVRWPVNCFTRSRTMFNLILVKLIMHSYWTSMFWSIDSCQNRVPADQYHLTVSRAQVSTHRGQVFLKLSADKLLVLKWSQAQVQFFSKFIRNMLCFCATQLKFWLQTDLGRENSASCYRQGRQLVLTFLTMVTRWSRVGFCGNLWCF